MSQYTQKQRQMIRLAYNSKDPDLRRRAVAHLRRVADEMEAGEREAGNYNPRFVEEMKGLGEFFANPNYNPNNPRSKQKVRWNSLTSQAQSEAHQKYNSGDFDEVLRGQYGEDWQRTEGEGGKRTREEGGAGSRGTRYADRKEIRTKPKKSMDDSTSWTDEELSAMLPMDKLDRLSGNKKERFLNGLRGQDFNGLDTIAMGIEYAAEHPDDPWSKDHWAVKDMGFTADDMRSFHKGIQKKFQEARGRRFHKNVVQVANDNDLEDEDPQAVLDFRLDKPETGRQLTPEQLFQKFLNHPKTSPETRERMKDMNVQEFMAMYNSIMKDEDEDELVFGGGEGGRQASKRAGEEDEESVWPPNLLEPPPGGGKKASRLSPIGRRLVRMAYESSNPDLRRKLIRRAKSELGL